MKLKFDKNNLVILGGTVASLLINMVVGNEKTKVKEAKLKKQIAKEVSDQIKNIGK